jgi:hypothetical protein
MAGQADPAITLGNNGQGEARCIGARDLVSLSLKDARQYQSATGLDELD